MVFAFDSPLNFHCNRLVTNEAFWNSRISRQLRGAWPFAILSIEGCLWAGARFNCVEVIPQGF